MSETVYIIAGGLAILLIGLGLGFWAAQLRSGKQVAKAADVQRQFDDYRESVTAHFGRTAEHFQTISQQYRELYEHMASGAVTLIDPQAIDEKLSFVPGAAIEASGDEDESGEVETPVAEPVDVTDDQDAEATAQTSEDAAESQRTYH
jgi:uncharacterized membrane-anchored protein YhcB (DUF1043 family)